MPELIKYQPRVFERFTHKPSHERVFGKTAMNFLAFVAGEDFVNREAFTAVKNWIVNDADYSLKEINTNKRPFAGIGLDIPQDAHAVELSLESGNITAKVAFYGHFAMNLVLAENFSDGFLQDGFICDWKNQKEHRFLDIITAKKDGLLA